jgi:NADPH2:quinone reductase
LLCQIARMRGATVIGTVSTDAKAAAAKEAGAAQTILYTEVDFAEEAKRLTDNRGVDVIYDAVGQTTFMKGFDCLRPRGMMVSYGQASGPVPAVEGAQLSRGSFYYARTGLAAHTATREELLRRANDIFDWVGSEKLNVHIFGEFPLAEAAKAQSALEHRETIGKVLLIP